MFNHDGDDSRLVINKDDPTYDATVTFQDQFSTRAQMGIAGTNDWDLKVGSSFIQAMRVEEATGRVFLPQTPQLTEFIFPISGQFLMDPGEFNGWGEVGAYDISNTRDLGNVGAATVSYLAGGLVFPFDVIVKRLFVDHRNTNGTAEAWGWRMTHVDRVQGSTAALPATDIINEVSDNGGTGPRDYGAITPQRTDITVVSPTFVPAGRTIVLGVESPTAVATNYYVQCLAGYILLERVNN